MDVPIVIKHNDGRVTMAPPPMPLVPRTRPPAKSEDGIKLKLRSEPTNPDSSTYTFFMRFYKADMNDPEWYSDWVLDLKRVIRGHNITGGPARYQLARDLLRGRHLYDFNSFAQQLGAETIPHFEECIRKLGLQIYPPQARSRMLFAIRNSKKEDFQTVRDYVGRLQDISIKMEVVDPLLLDDDQTKDIVVRAMPDRYMSRMTNQGFKPEDHTVVEVIDLFERYEAADLILNIRGRGRVTPRGRRGRNAQAQFSSNILRRNDGRRRQHRRDRHQRNNLSRSFNPQNRPFFARNNPRPYGYNGYSSARYDPRGNNRAANPRGNNHRGFRPNNPGRHNNQNRNWRDNNPGGGNRRNNNGQNNARREEANALDELRVQTDGSDSDSTL